MSNNSSETEIPTAPGSTRFGLILVIGTAAVLAYCWSLWLAATDRPNDGTPDALIDVIAILALGGLLFAATLGVGYDLADRAYRNAMHFELVLQKRLADVRSDTGEIPKITQTLQRAEVIVVREPDRAWPSADRAQLTEVLAEAAHRQPPLRPSVPADEVWDDEKWRTYVTGLYDQRHPPLEGDTDPGVA